MANQQARVTSTEALEAFRASLIVFLEKGRRSVDDVTDEVRRTRIWLQQDRRTYWEAEIKRRAKALNQAQQELMSVRITGDQQGAVVTRQAAVIKAQRAVAEGEARLRGVKKWIQNYDSVADPVIKRLENLRQLLDNDMPKAVAYLANAQRTLEAYADTLGPESASMPATVSTSEPQAETPAESQP